MTQVLTHSYRENERLTKENLKLKDTVVSLKQNNSALNGRVRVLTSENQKLKETIELKEQIIEELKHEIAHLNALQNHNGTNTGQPTAKTKIGGKKIIPNSRRSSGKVKGGQKGHPKYSMSAPESTDENEIEEHVSSVCPKCESTSIVEYGEPIIKHEYDVRIRVVKVKHVFYGYKCTDCGRIFHMTIPLNLKENAQYGNGVQAMILSLINSDNVPINKIASFFDGITGGNITPSEGFIAKVQGRFAVSLETFVDDLRLYLIQQSLIYWDDTVIFVNTKRACLRFYGDEKISLYKAHEHKDFQSLQDDEVLHLLTNKNKVMHDHNKVNYNSQFVFENLECNQHLQRDLQKNTDDIHHTWSSELKIYISTTIFQRKEMIAQGATEFPSDKINEFYNTVDSYLELGQKEHEKDIGKYGADFENALLLRIKKYQKNYFSWVEDFSLPTTNNLSERALRGIKSHQKISGQFESIKASQNFANVKSYIETCRKSGINEIMSLQRLAQGKPYTVAEIFKT